MNIAPVTLTYTDGSTITLSRSGDIVTASAIPSATATLPGEFLPIPAGFSPRGDVMQYSFRHPVVSDTGQYGIVIDEIGAGSGVGIGLQTFSGEGPYTPFSTVWLADADTSSQVDNSILNSTKKILGLDPGYDRFDIDVITHINSTFAQLAQLGAGPDDGFEIQDSTAVWSDFLEDNKVLNFIKTYMYLKVRMWFDPPTTSFDLAAKKEQIIELEWRINVAADPALPIEPTIPVE